LGHLMWVAAEVARDAGVDEAFRLVVNNGEGAGQTVFHLHVHVLAGSKGSPMFSEADIG
jgi:histidine triad (HIT) family protein